MRIAVGEVQGPAAGHVQHSPADLQKRWRVKGAPLASRHRDGCKTNRGVFVKAAGGERRKLLGQNFCVAVLHDGAKRQHTGPADLHSAAMV